MKFVHLVIPDLFLPRDVAAEASRGLHLPVLEMMLGRGRRKSLQPAPLENLLFEIFGMPCQHNAPVAGLSAVYDGLGDGNWLRADPVNLNLRRNQLMMAVVGVTGEEAIQLCASLNGHFAGQGMEFFAPHPQRWYVRLEDQPRMDTTPFSQVIGGDISGALPVGEDSARWHQVSNETQMLLHAHPLNESREARGEPAVNSVWFWGGGYGQNLSLKIDFDAVNSDDVLTEMLSSSAGVTFSGWPSRWDRLQCDGNQLLVWTGLRSAMQQGDLATWRTALQEFESSYALPLWQALRSGNITQLKLDILSTDSLQKLMLTRGDSWAFWRSTRRLDEHSMV